MAWGGGNEEQVRGRGGRRVAYRNFSTSLFMKGYNSDYNTVCMNQPAHRTRHPALTRRAHVVEEGVVILCPQEGAGNTTMWKGTLSLAMNWYYWT